MIRLFTLMMLLVIQIDVKSQNNLCNKLGVWLWYIDITGFGTQAEIAEEVANMGAKRVYAKVADGRVNTTIWPELIDKNLTKAYKEKGLEIWAWSYNYPKNDSLQAEALYIAAQTGFQGYVVDVESEFDNNFDDLKNLFKAFDAAKKRAIKDGFINENFKLYVTTWGNPIDHNFKINAMDSYVDGYMPQTYVENWGLSYTEELTKWINVGTKEYRDLGATKPIHHMLATEKNIISVDKINEFISVAGGETSLWRIPGGGVPLDVWDTWKKLDWKKDFCTTSTTDDLSDRTWIYPNPTNGILHLDINDATAIIIRDQLGKIVSKPNLSNNQISLSNMENGLYHIGVFVGNNWVWSKVMKM